MNDPLVQLEASKPLIKDLFRDSLIETKDFKYQITLKVLLSKQKQNGDKEFSTVYLDYSANTNKYGLHKSFRQVLYRIDNWINEGSTWTIECIDGEYINISIYNLLSGSTYIELPNELKNSKKGTD